MGQPVVHFEVIARDGPAMRAFYSSLFDWRIDTDNSWEHDRSREGPRGLTDEHAPSEAGLHQRAVGRGDGRRER
jgi:predicted enzyme related to lactoylglutathione lyase